METKQQKSDLNDWDFFQTYDKEKKREAMNFAADLSDRDIRRIRAVSQGMSLGQYEKVLRNIGVDF